MSTAVLSPSSGRAITVVIPDGSTGAPGLVQLAPPNGTTAGLAVQANDPRLSGASGTTGTTAAVTIYGSARDGNVTFDGSNAVTNWSLAASTYTYTGTADLHYDVVTISSGVTLKLEGWRFLCRNYNPNASNNVTVDVAGTAASSNTAGTSAGPSTLATTSAGATFYGAPAAAGGRVTNSNGTNATAVAAGAVRGGGAGGNAGRVRFSSGGAIATAGSASSGTNASNPFRYYGDPWQVLLGPLPYYRNGTGIAQIAGGGGGGGAPLSTTGASGGGGGGGGILAFAAATAAFGTGCSFVANGGAGGNGSVTASTGSVAGGGGGGGGGMILALFGEITGSNLPSFAAYGGNGGNAALDTTGYWAEGGNGGSGGYAQVYVGTNYVGGTPTITVTGGAGGTNQGSGTGFTGSVDGTDGLSYYGEGS